MANCCRNIRNPARITLFRLKTGGLSGPWLHIVKAAVEVWHFRIKMVINIFTRDSWGADAPKLETPTNWKVTHVFWMNVKRNVCYTPVHCVELLRRAQRYNMTVQNQRDIRYNFMIGGDGNVYEGRGWGNTPLLPKEYGRVNVESCLIGFMGQFNTARELPAHMFSTGQDLISNGIASRFIVKDFIFYDFLVNDRTRDEQEQQKEIKQSRPVRYQPDPLANPFQRQGLREERDRIFGKRPLGGGGSMF